MSTEELFAVICPYCGEEVELFVESDVSGRFVQDCEVCCRPWSVRVADEVGERTISVSREDDGD
ncbi:MAG: CPXCG motif-containing cysteine-rich protein [Thermoanaerobaculia bacterium]